MSTSTLGLFLRHLALSEEVSRLGTVSDPNLLAAHESGRAEAAFAELMRRHGPMVLRTCRRILGRGPDAEDAFQATFILLARKTAQLRREAAGRQSLCGWLHRVAYHTALQTLARTTRRRVHERQAGAMIRPDPDPILEAGWNEIRPILDAELDALPEQPRQLLIACYLQGKTHAEAAAELGLPLGSLARRLDRARALLATRLARRGVTVSATLLGVLLGDLASGAVVPAVLLVHTLEAARMFGEQVSGVVSDSVARLVKGGLAQMTKSSTHLSILLAAWVGLLGAGLIACQTLKAWPDQKPPSEPPATPTAERPAQERDKPARTDRHGDPLPAEALVRMGTTRLRHMDRVREVLFAPDGKTVVSKGDDTVRLWDVTTGKLVRRLRLGKDHQVSFSQDGKTLASWNNKQIWLWATRTGELLCKKELKREENQEVFSLAFSSDGKMVASCEHKRDYKKNPPLEKEKVNQVLRLWDIATGNPLRVLQEHVERIQSLSFSPDNKTLASVAIGDDKVVRLWDVSSGKLLHKLEHPLMVVRVSFSPDGKTLASGDCTYKPEGNPSAVRLWDVATGKLFRTLEGHQHSIISLSFSADGKVLASGSADRTIRLWDVTAGKELRTLKGPQPGWPFPFAPIWSLSFAPDGKMLASSGINDPTVHLWDMTTGKELHRPEGAHTSWVHSISFSPDGRTLATGAVWGEEEDTVRIWDAASGKPLRRLEHPGVAHSVAFAPDGKMLATGGTGVVCLWDVTTGKQRHKLEASDDCPLAFSPDGKLLAAGSDTRGEPISKSKGTLRLWDVATGTQFRTLEHPYRIITSVAFSPDGKMLAVGTEGARGRAILHLWDAVTGKERLKGSGEWGKIAALSFSPDGKILAASSGAIYLVEVSTGKKLRTLTGHSSHAAIAFSPNGRWLASASTDQTVTLWEVSAGLASQCRLFRGHEGSVAAVAFSPDGRRLASGSCDSTALVWDVTGLAGGQARAPRLTSGELTGCWQSLMNTDAARAYQTLRTLVGASEQAVPFLAGRLLPKRPDPKQVARRLAELDSDDFRVRSKATEELEKLGEVVEPALRQVLKEKPSLEVHRRIQQLLEKIDPPHPEGVSLRLLRWLRAVEVLEWIDTPAARELLEKVGAAPPREEVGREAKASLRRLRALSTSD